MNAGNSNEIDQRVSAAIAILCERIIFNSNSESFFVIIPFALYYLDTDKREYERLKTPYLGYKNTTSLMSANAG